MFIIYFSFDYIKQISTTDLYITWESFEDIEETQTISHSSGIQNYFLGIGEKTKCLSFFHHSLRYITENMDRAYTFFIVFHFMFQVPL